MLSIISQSSASMMIRRQAVVVSRRTSSSKAPAELLKADQGPLSTHVNHGMSKFLAVAAPVLFLWPGDSDNFVNKAFSVLVAVNISAHSWIGLNHVCADYVPKISKSLLPPVRYANAGIGLFILLGLSKIALFSKGGIVGCIKGLWNPPLDNNKKNSF